MAAPREWTTKDQERLDQAVRGCLGVERRKNQELDDPLGRLEAQAVVVLRQQSGMPPRACLEALRVHGHSVSQAMEHLRATGLAIAYRGPLPACGVPLCRAEGMSALTRPAVNLER